MTVMSRETVQGLILRNLESLTLSANQHGEMLHEIKLQTQKTNGRVTALEEKEQARVLREKELLQTAKADDHWKWDFRFGKLLPWIISLISIIVLLYVTFKR